MTHSVHGRCSRYHRYGYHLSPLRMINKPVISSVPQDRLRLTQKYDTTPHFCLFVCLYVCVCSLVASLERTARETVCFQDHQKFSPHRGNCYHGYEGLTNSMDLPTCLPIYQSRVFWCDCSSDTGWMCVLFVYGIRLQPCKFILTRWFFIRSHTRPSVCACV